MGYLALLSIALGVLRFIAWGINAVWGRAARLEAKIAELATAKALAKAERERLAQHYKDIDAAPPADDPAKGLNDAWNKKRP